MPCRATNTRSYPSVYLRSTREMQSRICRLSLFRLTAFASFLLTDMPTLKFPVSFRV